jgi:Na+/H+ antiporter NhaD/arsenite permease-like protein
MGILAGLSMLMTRRETRDANGFAFYPIVEVAVIFAGIFATMIPALAILEARGGELGLKHPWQFFWVTGGLSSFLDNAPTYLTFASMASGLMGDGSRAPGPASAGHNWGPAWGGAPDGDLCWRRLHGSE